VLIGVAVFFVMGYISSCCPAFETLSNWEIRLVLIKDMEIKLLQETKSYPHWPRIVLDINILKPKFSPIARNFSRRLRSELLSL
jgi:hypothetical protein